MAALRSWLILGFGLGLVSSSGCMVVATATGNVLCETKTVLDDCLEQHRNRRWAESAWNQQCMEQGLVESDPDFACGFKDGFAAHLYRGTVEPPALPPTKYRSLKYQSPEGCGAVVQWRAGFRQGVQVAKEGGYRRYVTCWLGAGVGGPPPQPVVPTPLLNPPPPPPVPLPVEPGKGRGPVPYLPVPGELLPPPKPVSPPSREQPTTTLQEVREGPLLPAQAEDGRPGNSLACPMPAEFEQTFITIPASGTKREDR